MILERLFPTEKRVLSNDEIHCQSIPMGWLGCWFESITNIWIMGGQYGQVYLTSVSLDIICILVLNALAFLEEPSITHWFDIQNDI